MAANSDSQHLNVGAAMLGGSIFGAVCGCTAAGVAEAITKDHDKRPRWSEQVRTGDVAVSAAVASAPPPSRLLTVRTSLDGLTMTLLGTPESGSKQVTLQLKRFGSSPEIATCQMLDLQIDDRQLHFPVRGRGQTQGSLVAETAQANIAIEVVQALQAAKQTSVRLCSLERHLNVDARSALGDFVHEFSVRAPGALAEAVHGPTPTQSAVVSPQVEATLESGRPQ